jgi:hypothetical protein
VRPLLAGAGFTGIEIDPLQAPMWLGAGPGDAYTFAVGLLGWMLDGLDQDHRAEALAALRATITAHATTDGVLYKSATWLIRARRAQRSGPADRHPRHQATTRAHSQT